MRTETLAIAVCTALTLVGCCINPFRNTRTEQSSGAPHQAERTAHTSIQPAQPAVQPTRGIDSVEPGAGFDIRLVRVQPAVHLGSVQACDVVFCGRPEAIEGESAQRYSGDAEQRMAIKCHAPSGEGWADLVFTPDVVHRLPEVTRGRRVRVRIIAPDGGYFDYPIVRLVAIEEMNPDLARAGPRVQPSTVPNAFDLRDLRDDPALVGTTQQCSVSFADDIDLVRPNDRRRRSYPAGVQNRMTVRCHHSGGDEPADLVFMPAQALAALSVRRGEVLPVRVISRHGGFVDYPILQFAGQ